MDKSNAFICDSILKGWDLEGDNDQEMACQLCFVYIIIDMWIAL